MEEAFLAVFECPICLAYMMPPIRQCTQGHCFCNDCFNNVSRCSICGYPKSNVPCLTMDKIHAILTFPCKFKNEGCDFVGKASDLGTHQIDCKYSITLCPLRFNNCRWRGIMAKMVGHCKEKHPDNISYKNKQKLMVSNFREPMDRNYYIIFNVFGTLFRCTWDLSRSSGAMRFAVYHVGCPQKHERYSFEVSIFSGIKNADVITRKGPCFQMECDNERFMGEKYLSARHSFIKEFCDEHGDLRYSVTVMKTTLTNNATLWESSRKCFFDFL
ncbi:hypothetical protein JTB14_036343 [Gonioctena quinquepunctata]|nr:hypothetical protein JTB14_036343 [Gonioctena quinquepunctata]